MWAAIVACVIVFGAPLPYAQCENKTMASSGTSPISVERITELYFTIVDLIERFDRGEMPHYSKFFDAALMRKARNVFGQLYGYARNETQGIEWEEFAVKFFQLYVIRTSGAYANAQYNYYADVLDKKIDEPCSLRKACLAQLTQQIQWHLSNNSLKFNANDYMLGYLLRSFSALPVLVKTTNSLPFLVVQLNENYNRERFLNETSNAISVYPIPYSPDENFAYEIGLFRRAQSSIYDLAENCPAVSRMREYVDAGIDAYINQFFNDIITNCTTVAEKKLLNKHLCCLRGPALVLYSFVFLEDEYRRLMCHPAYKIYSASERIKNVITLQQNYLRAFYESITMAQCHCGSLLCSTLRSLYESLWRMQPSVGYSRARSTGIAVVERTHATQTKTKIMQSNSAHI